MKKLLLTTALCALSFPSFANDMASKATDKAFQLEDTAEAGSHVMPETASGEVEILIDPPPSLGELDIIEKYIEESMPDVGRTVVVDDDVLAEQRKTMTRDELVDYYGAVPITKSASEKAKDK